jgi:hypothetical protein
LSKIPSGKNLSGQLSAFTHSGGRFFQEAIMDFLVHGIILFVAIAILMLVEGFLRALWVREYYARGLKVYDRSFSKGERSLPDVYSRIANDKADDGLKKIIFHMTQENDHLLFRNRFGWGLTRNISLIHGTIYADDDHFRIRGFLGLTEALYGCLIPLILLILFILSNYSSLLLIAAAFLGITALYYFLVYSSSRRILDRI